MPWMPAERSHREGGTKQDGAVNAAKRLLPTIRQDDPDLVLHFRNEKQVNFLFPRLFTECQL